MLEKETDSFNCREYFHYNTLISIDQYILEEEKKRQGEIAARLAEAWRQKASELGKTEPEKRDFQNPETEKVASSSKKDGYIRPGELRRDYFSVIEDEIGEDEIRNIFVLDTVPEDPGTEKYDVSYEEDNSVVLWTKKKEEEDDLYIDGIRFKNLSACREGYDLYIGGRGGIKAPEDCSNLFGGYKNVKKILFQKNFKTEKVRNMRGMFWGCRQLEKIDVSNFSTYNVRSMSGMFNECNQLEEINIKNFITGNVTDMSDMFYGCERLAELDVRNFDTRNVENMSGMFYGCAMLKEIDIRNFTLNKVKSVSGMFKGCKRLDRMGETRMLRQCEGWKDRLLMQGMF